MTRTAIATGLTMWAGATLALSQLRWFARPGLAARLRPFSRTAPQDACAQTFRAALEPLARAVGARLSRLFGVDDDLALRLERLHSPLDVSAFRIRQIGWSTLVFGVGAVLAMAARVPGPLTVLLVVGGPLLAFLVLEQRVATASERWQQRMFHELPLVTEQLAALLTAGYSLGGAMNRLAQRGSGVCAAELARVCARVRQGLTEREALLECAARSRVDALDRLVAVLALERQAADLGRLLEGEAHALRSDVHRRAVEVMERRAQQVWIPVTVATLVPGVVFLAIPFIDALRVFSGA